ncbi:MAG TPA: SWIB/MDM2 domain-containing protein [Sphingomonas sp.]|jgi:chromatin remodeling complex protein RSC6
MATAKQDAGAKKAATKQTKEGTGIHAPVKPSAELGAIVGTDSLPRSEVISKVWEYIKKQELQNPQNKREILADDKLKKVFGKDSATMFEMNKYISAHLTKA